MALKHMEVSLNYCSQNGGNLYRAPYYNRNPNIGPRIIGNLDQSPHGRSKRSYLRREVRNSNSQIWRGSRSEVQVAGSTTLRRVENARREARQVCSNVKITGRRGIFCSARSPGGRAGSRKNCEQNPANCAAAVVSRARRRLSMRGVAYSAGRTVIFSMTVWTCSLRETQRQSHTDTQRQQSPRP